MVEYFFNKVCKDCFFEVQKEKGSCVCPLEVIGKDKSYYCSFCEEFHGPGNSVVCRECFNKEFKEQGIS